MPTFADSSDPAAPLRLKTRWFDRVLLVEVAGEVELLNAPRVESELMAALDERPAVLVLDIMFAEPVQRSAQSERIGRSSSTGASGPGPDLEPAAPTSSLAHISTMDTVHTKASRTLAR
ncbi:hypothetical protein [Saccharopolyspora phatthalungensis]|uniref:STAS domain-containing protein n=1 Tax=Saccharopolyspora phatthalungensis TaxID=664693 RepID=A0A840QAV0_9PSEU|nr:hypothetical protein [Saccharopolyspora phatthalungensis]MBB5156901.1 hypothetical protein [Saccharopolyspora phatthalungensis]